MQWHHGPHGEQMRLWRPRIEAGERVPPSLIDNPEPEVWIHLEVLWVAFHELGTERQVGMGIGPIPNSKTREFIRDELCLSGQDYEHAYAILKRMDSEYISIVNKKDDETKPRPLSNRSPKPLSSKASNGKRGKRSR